MYLHIFNKPLKIYITSYTLGQNAYSQAQRNKKIYIVSAPNKMQFFNKRMHNGDKDTNNKATQLPGNLLQKTTKMKNWIKTCASKLFHKEVDHRTKANSVGIL